MKDSFPWVLKTFLTGQGQSTLLSRWGPEVQGKRQPASPEGHHPSLSRHGLGMGSQGPQGPARSWGDCASGGGPLSLAGKIFPRVAASPAEVSHWPSEQFTVDPGKPQTSRPCPNSAAQAQHLMAHPRLPLAPNKHRARLPCSEGPRTEKGTS
jgi:hypothetical protein